MKSKLVKCKSCGANIAKNAKTCPQCGAKRFQGVYIACGIVVAITIFAVFITLGNAFGKDGASAAEPEQSAPQAIEISAHDLWKAYADNQVKADNLYKDKTLSVTGVIVDIGKDMVLGNPCVSLKSGDQLGIYPVQCFFTDDKQNEKLAALSDGQSITIEGTCAGAPIANVQMTDCTLQG